MIAQSGREQQATGQCLALLPPQEEMLSDNLLSMSKKEKKNPTTKCHREPEAAAAWGEDAGWRLVMRLGQRASLLSPRSQGRG